MIIIGALLVLMVYVSMKSDAEFRKNDQLHSRAIIVLQYIHVCTYLFKQLLYFSNMLSLIASYT